MKTLKDRKLKALLDESKPLEMRYALALQKIEHLNERLGLITSRQRAACREKITDQRRRYEAQIKELRRDYDQELKLAVSELERHQKAGARSLESLLMTLKYAASYLGPHEPKAAEKVMEVYEQASSSLQPVADVPEIVDLLRRWVGAAPLADMMTVAALINETESTLDQLGKGR